MFDQGGRMSLDDIISTVATDQNVNYWLLLGEGPRMERFMAGAICWLYDAYEQFYKAGGLSDTPWIEGARQYMRYCHNVATKHKDITEWSASKYQSAFAVVFIPLIIEQHGLLDYNRIITNTQIVKENGND